MQLDNKERSLNVYNHTQLYSTGFKILDEIYKKILKLYTNGKWSLKPCI